MSLYKSIYLASVLLIFLLQKHFIHGFFLCIKIQAFKAIGISLINIIIPIWAEWSPTSENCHYTDASHGEQVGGMF